MNGYQNAAVYGAFLAEGLHDAGYHAVLSKWDQGCLELMLEITTYVPFIGKIIDTTGGNFDFPGVFDYEVVSAFGLWFGQKILFTGVAPPRDTCEAKLVTLSYEFFKRGVDTDAERDELMARLRGLL